MIPTVDSGLEARLDELRQRHGVVGATAGIVQDGKTRLAASGLLNLETGVEATPDAVFQIGSIGKLFTATLIMQLVDEGRLDLDVPVRHYLPDFVIKDKTAAARITTRMLLCHLSGMEGDLFPDDDPSGPSNSSLFRKMCLLPQLTAPGEEPMAYCNSGFVVAGRLIEVLTEKTWADAVMQRICGPLGMTHAFAHPKESLRFRCAMGHMSDPHDPQRLIVAPATYLPLSAAAAGSVLSMSAADLLLFAQAHMDEGDMGDGGKLLSPASVRAMRVPQTALPAFTLPDFNHWGLGWMLGEFAGYQSCGHDGATLGQNAYLRMFPQQRVAMVLLCSSPSSNFFLDFFDREMESAMGLQREPEPAAQPWTVEAGRYVGSFQNISAAHEVRLQDGELRLTLVDRLFGSPRVDAALQPYRPDVFTVVSDDPRHSGAKLSFLGADETGRARFSRVTVRMLRRTDPS